MMATDKTCAEIDLELLAENLSAIKRRVSPARVIAVVKADAYGHGAVPVARRLVRDGVDFFAVAQFQEAMELRDSGIDRPILVFGRIFPDQIPEAVRAGLRISVFGTEDIRWIENAPIDAPALVHAKIDTGMGRVGIQMETVLEVLEHLHGSRSCRWEGMYSHFSTSDEKDKSFCSLQLKRFEGIMSETVKRGIKPEMIHMANSGAVLDLPKSFYNAVRPGIILYGHYPSSETSESVALKQVMTFKTYVAHIRNIPAGQPVSYGRRWTSKKPTTLAVLPVGYADGVRRSFTNTGEVLIGAKRFPIVGTVTMDQIMVDVGNTPAGIGDEAILWGQSKDGCLQALEAAEKIGTIPYELTCGVTKRVIRKYV